MSKSREQWLQECVAILAEKLFAPAGYKVPQVAVSVGFPSRSALSARRRRIGECWSPTVAGDNVSQIFISPVLSDDIEVVATLAHEVVHAVVGLEAKHGPVFKKCATAIGLVGKMTATSAGEELAKWIAGPECAGRLNAYPHPTFSPSLLSRDKQSTRLIKLECPGCGYVARTTRKWLEAIGLPKCACDDIEMEVKS